MNNTQPVYIGLHTEPVYFIDTTEKSPDLFQIKEFPTQLNAGRNLFKLHGNPRNLKEESLLYIEILDFNGTPIPYEISDLIEEDESRIIIIHILPNTPSGNVTITLVGTAEYIEGVTPPMEWANRNNVMWQRQVYANPTVSNSSEIIFGKTPTVTISEQISVQFDREYDTTQVVTYNSGSIQYISNNSTPIAIISGGIFTSDMIGGTLTISTPVNPIPSPRYTLPTIPYVGKIQQILDNTSAILDTNYVIESSQSKNKVPHRYDGFDASSYSIEYTAPPKQYVPTENSESYALIEIDDLEPLSGDISRIKVFSSNIGTVGTWEVISDTELKQTDIFVTNTASIQPYVSIGNMSNTIIQTYYTASAFNGFTQTTPPSLIYTGTSSIYSLPNSMYINSTHNLTNRTSVDIVEIKNEVAGKFNAGSTYKLNLTALGTRTSNTGNTDPVIYIYASGSAFNTDYRDFYNTEFPKTLGQLIGQLHVTSDSTRFDNYSVTFNADNDGTGVLLYVIKGGEWQLSNIQVTTNTYPGYTPNYTRIRSRIPTTHKSGVQQTFKIEYYNKAGERSNYISSVENLTWQGGNHYIDGDYNLITGSIFVADKLTTGLEFAGRKNSGMIRTVGYTGWNDKKQGIHIWSGSALTSSTTNYNGVGVEMYESEDNYFRFTTDTNITRSLDFRTNTFFLGNSTSSISSNGGDIIFSGSITIPGLVLSQSLSDVLTNGSSSGVNDIYMGTGTFIRSNNGTGYITLDSNIGNWMQFGVTDTSSYSSIDITDINDNPSVSLRTYDSGNLTAISLASTGILISTYNSGGMFYETDYSGNYQNRSLVDKQYVDNTINTAVSTGTSLYAQTASYALTALTASYFSGSILNSITASYAESGNGIFSGSFSGSFIGNGSGLTGIKTNTGNVLYVSPTGSDADTTRSGHIGDIMKPFLTLKAARDAAISGDLIHVFPQTFVFDNRDSNSNYWNTRINDLNLWKNGVTYYFEPNCKIQFYNQTGTGNAMALINPGTGSNESCIILGYLEYEQYGTGPDTSIGHCRFYYDTNSNAHTFYSNIKSLYSNCNEYINIFRSVTGSAESKITIISDTETRLYSAGQSGTGAAVFIGGIAYSTIDDSGLNLTLTTRYRDILDAFPVYVYGNLNRSKININGDTCVIKNQGHILRRGTFTLNYNVNKTYYTRHQSGNLWYGSFISTDRFDSGSIIVNGDLIDYLPNTETNGIFHIGSTSNYNTINFTGNIYTNTTSGSGRFIALTDGTVKGNTININGNINYIGTGSTTQYMFRSSGSADNTINFNGVVNGTFAGTIAQCYNGTININNSNIQPTTDSTSSMIFSNGNTSLGTVKINNSYIRLSNSGSIGSGSYVKAIVNQSTIINAGTGTGLINTTSSGSLNLINSTILVTSQSIDYPSGSVVVMSNATTNASWSMSNPVGSINLITDITY